MKATVTNVIANGTWDAHDKTFHKFEITIGEHKGEYMSDKFTDKDADNFPFKVGEEAEYEYVPHERYPKIKLPKSEGGGYYKGKAGSNSSFALSYAKDVLVASYMTPNMEAGGHPITTDNMFALADKMVKWLNDN